MLRPVSAGQSCPERFLQAAVKSLHQPVGLGMVSRSNRIFMPSWRDGASQTEEQNCLPWSEVTCSRTPNLAI